jgi:hypothetical protein
MGQRPRTPPARAGERGLALAMTMFAMTVLVMAAAAASMIASADVHATRNYRGATQAHFVAESGISHALQSINAVGVLDFDNEVVGGWDLFLGSSSRAFSATSGFRYTVTPLPDAADAMNRGYLRAVATGTDGTRNVVVARILRTNIPATAPGAIYLATDQQTNSDFRGNSWRIDGNDHLYSGGAGPEPPIPGLSTRTQANTDEAIASLNGTQLDNVTGLGYQAGSPPTPSIMTSPSAPSMSQLNQIVDTLIAEPPPIFQSIPNTSIQGNAVFGTPDSPKITYFPSSTTIRGGGTVDGAGILIVEGDLTIAGDLNFKGLIIVRGRTTVDQHNEGDTVITGHANIYGSLWTYDVDLVVGGSANVFYSSQALALANNTVVTGALPAPVRIVSLADCAQLAAGVGGCP